jgi:NTP pyrophosphatase (non-canonical NTP hydrolase)
MDFNEYQKKARETAIYPDKGSNLIYPALKLAGEAGEVAEKIGKLMRDRGYKPGAAPWTLTPYYEPCPITFTEGDLPSQVVIEIEEDLIKELGDVLWYIAALASEMNLSLGWIARKNLEKLADRAKRNVLGGSGDNR